MSARSGREQRFSIPANMPVGIHRVAFEHCLRPLPSSIVAMAGRKTGGECRTSRAAPPHQGRDRSPTSTAISIGRTTTNIIHSTDANTNLSNDTELLPHCVHPGSSTPQPRPKPSPLLGRRTINRKAVSNANNRNGASTPAHLKSVSVNSPSLYTSSAGP